MTETEQRIVALLVKAATPSGLSRRKTRRAFRHKARIADANGAFIAPKVAAALRRAARYWKR